MNRIKRDVWVGVALVLAGLVAALATEGKAIAQAARAALVQNVDEPARNAYNETASCFTTNCIVSFSPVPAGKRLMVTFVNGQIEAGPGFVELGGHGSVMWSFVTAHTALSDFFNSPVRGVFDAGETPQIGCLHCSPTVSTAPFLTGTLAGYFVNLP